MRAGLNLLLVCRDPSWSQAVHDAMDARHIDACDARDALARLAGIVPNYSHLLLQPCCDDGLFDALVQLTSEAAGSDTELLMLGGLQTPPSYLNTIRSATSRSVQEALMVGPRSRRSHDAPFDPAELQAVLDAGMISARYQPIVRVSDRVPTALEALARLNHPDQGTVLPDRFIPQIEDAGLAGKLTELMTERAFADLTGAALDRHDLLTTLNFPLDVILRPAAIDRLERQRKAAGLPAHRIVIELTESRPVQDFDALRPVLQRLRGLGYRVAIDDVSPDVPSLGELLELPFTSLKFDKDLISLAMTDETALEFVRETTRRAQQAKMLVVAEGVETMEIWHLVRSLGINGAQGFLLARPLPAAAVPVWLDAWPTNPAFA